MIVEVAIESVSDAGAAEQAGAGRLELCAGLRDGGTTPSMGAIRVVVARAHVPVFVLVRPRSGDFLYAAEEVELMLRDVEAAKHGGAQGIVGGALHANGAIDEDATQALLESAAPLPFTFHRAFDLTRDLDASLDTLMALGVARVLTSGGEATAMEGAGTIARLATRGTGRITVIAGGGVRAAHARDLVQRTGVTEVHLGPRRPVVSGMRHRKTRVAIGKGSDSQAWEADADAVAAAVGALHGAT